MALPYTHLYAWSERTLALADALRKKLEAAGFTETRWSKEGRFYDPRNHFQFFRQDTELTALFVNLEPQPHRGGIMIRYGLDSTAFTRMKGDEESLLNWGLGADDACLRWEVSVTAAEDPAAAEQVAAHFLQYRQVNTDEDLREILDNFLKNCYEPILAGNTAALPEQLLCQKQACPREDCPLRQ